MTSELLVTRLAGAVWGHLIGDAVGVPYEFWPADQVGEVRFGARGTYGQPPGTWSDDGSLMLALLDSLLSAGFDPQDQAARALAWRDEGAYTPDGDGAFDIGTTTGRALAAIRSGTPAEEAGPADLMACGNGSLMRILPLALVERGLSPGELVGLAHRASGVTHGHPRPQVACALYVLLAQALLLAAGTTDAFGLMSTARAQLRGIYAQMPLGQPHLEALDHLESWTGREGKGRVWDSLWSAWDAFAGASDYASAIERAIRYGNDTDTTAAIAGGLAGLRWGFDGLPTDWLAGMRGRDVVTPLVDRLVESVGWSTSTLHPIRVDRVDLALVPRLASASGALGMTFLPGKKGNGLHADYWRDLEADAACLRQVHGVDTLLLLVEDHELADARVTTIGDAMRRAGIDLVRHPILDVRVPADADAFRATLDEMQRRILAGATVAVACRGGLGRTGVAVGCLLRANGLGPREAIGLTRVSRPGTIETDEQADYVRHWPS